MAYNTSINPNVITMLILLIGLHGIPIAEYSSRYYSW